MGQCWLGEMLRGLAGELDGFEAHRRGACASC